jgi:hypothetical protein
MYFCQNTGTLHHIKDSRAYTLLRKLQFLRNVRGFSDKKLLGNFSLKSGVFRGLFSSMGWQPCQWKPKSGVASFCHRDRTA